MSKNKYIDAEGKTISHRHLYEYRPIWDNDGKYGSEGMLMWDFSYGHVMIYCRDGKIEMFSIPFERVDSKTIRLKYLYKKEH